MFTDSDRAIFAYHDGTKDRFADPLAINRKLAVLLAGDVEGAMKSAYASTGDADGSMQTLINAVREAFALTPFVDDTGAGVTDLMALRVLSTFSEFMIAKKI